MSDDKSDIEGQSGRPAFSEREIRSAFIVSLMRALHSRFDVEPLIDDPYGLVMLTPEDRAALRDFVMARRQDPPPTRAAADPDEAVLASVMRARSGYGNVVVRTRFAEDRLGQAIEGGTSQYVILGAGLDTFSLRQPALPSELRIFEVDHPATQEMKRRRFAAAGLTLPGNVALLPADLERTSVAEALSASDFEPDRPAFFSWLGVSPYLTEQANTQALRSIARCAAPGSGFVFTYLAPLENAEGTSYSRLHPQTVTHILDNCGFAVVEDLDAFELAGRYCAGRGDGLGVTTDFHIVHARMRG